MRQGRTIQAVMALAALAAVVAVMVSRRYVRKCVDRSMPEFDPSECEVSECGPDGTPLSLYAG